MKKNLKFLGMAFGVIAAASAVSCSNEAAFVGTGAGDNEVNLVKTPEIKAYVGSRSLAEVYSADVNGNLWYQNWDRPTNVTEDEIQKVLEAVKDPRVGEVNNLHIDWNNYWVQQVYTGVATYTDGFGNNIGTGSSHMNRLLAYSNKYRKQTSWYPTEEFEIVDKEEWNSPYEHVNNFNRGSNDTEYTDDVTRQKYYGTTLMTDMYAEGIIDQFGYENSTDSKTHYEYIIIEVDGNWYVCFDFYAVHPDGQDANKNMDVERDWIFNDWIVKISPAFPKGTTPDEITPPSEIIPSTPTQPEPEKPGCNCGGDPGNCPCGPGCECPDCNNPDEGDDNPDIVGPEKVNEHVEVNLSIEERDYWTTHLSIHVRAATDVEVFIPLPIEYYCQQDDLAIVNKHEAELMVHGGPKSLEYNINGKIVTLTVAWEAEGIRVTTDGIDEDVVDYCNKTFNDGITFEIWNYMNLDDTTTFIELEALKEYLNKSTIRFLDKTPLLYVNAFMWDPFGSASDIFLDDCTVSIVPEQIGEYPNNETGLFLNGSTHNELWWKN